MELIGPRASAWERDLRTRRRLCFHGARDGDGQFPMGRVANSIATFGSAAGLALIALLPSSTAPVSAQDIFGLFRLFSAPSARAPAHRYYYAPRYHHAPWVVERRRIRRPKAVHVDEPAVKAPIKPKQPGEVTNPLPDLLADTTLRRGDIVMFPDGPRVFAGQPGSAHALKDFVPASRAGGVLPASTRKLLATVRPDWHPGWSTAKANAATGTPQVETTGALRKAR
jgi:hypothetical protein